MSNVITLRNTGGFTRMDNDLYEALIGADLSGRELRVALAIHRLTAGFNKDSVKVAALYISKMMYADESKAEAERANVSRAINSLIRQRVIFRDGGSRDPISFLPVHEWKIDPKNTVLKSTHCVENKPATVLKITHIKDSKDILETSSLVGAAAPTDQSDDQESTPKPDQPKAERIPFAKIQEIYNRVCGGTLPECLKLSEDRKRNIRKCWNLQFNGANPFRKSEFWEGYFNDCLTNRHWIGENDRNWRADIEFLTREKTVLKVLEGA